LTRRRLQNDPPAAIAGNSDGRIRIRVPVSASSQALKAAKSLSVQTQRSGEVPELVGRLATTLT
jgi:hypothetical protein